MRKPSPQNVPIFTEVALGYTGQEQGLPGFPRAPEPSFEKANLPVQTKPLPSHTVRADRTKIKDCCFQSTGEKTTWHWDKVGVFK